MRYGLAFVLFFTLNVSANASDWVEEQPLDKQGFEIPIGIPINWRDIPLGISLADFRKKVPKESEVHVLCTDEADSQETFQHLLPAHKKYFGESCVMCSYVNDEDRIARLDLAGSHSPVVFNFIDIAGTKRLVEIDLRFPTSALFQLDRELFERYGTRDIYNRKTGESSWGNKCSDIYMLPQHDRFVVDLTYRLKSKKEQNLPGPPSPTKRFGIADF